MLNQQARTQSATANKTGLSFLLILSALMAVTSLSTDIYLPAMPMRARDLQGDAELTITGFLIGFCIAQLIWGPISDRYGRRLPLFIGLGLFIIGSVGCALSTDILQIADEINANGGHAEFRVTDVTDIKDVIQLSEDIKQRYGRIDHLINNAGLMLFSDWADIAVDDWNKMIDTNIHGYLNAIAATLPVFLEQKRGHILNMSSVAGLHTGASSGVYSATKFFIRGITESLRKEVGVSNGIQVSMISPGVIDTGWADRLIIVKAKKLQMNLMKLLLNLNRSLMLLLMRLIHRKN